MTLKLLKNIIAINTIFPMLKNQVEMLKIQKNPNQVLRDEICNISKHHRR